MGLDAATEALRWGVNDLGGTLMEESISRLAGSYHGTRLDPPQLIAAAHAAGRPAAERTTLYETRRESRGSARMTRRVALIGKPLRRRHSQVMHDAAFDANGIDARYELREIDPASSPPSSRRCAIPRGSASR